MNATPLSRRLATYGSIAALLVWGVLFIYLYTSGRIQQQVTPKFQLFALAAGFGMCVLALFNLITLKVKTACCHDHEEGHSQEDADHEHDECCGHQHGPECGSRGHAHAHSAHQHHAHEHHHEHDHEHGCCGHEHHDHGQASPVAAEHTHKHDDAHGCCGHDHHDHAHSHSAAHDHDHDHDHESPPGNIMVAILILLVPVLLAARISPEQFSPDYVIKWDTINRMIRRQNARQQVESMQSAENKALAATTKSVTTPGGADLPAAPASAASQTAPDQSPAPAVADGASGTPGNTGETAKKEGEWKEFSLADLERMVPRSSAGNFTLDIVQIFYTTSDKEVRKVLAGQPIETTAQVMQEKIDNPDGRRLRLFQLYIECCAADARPISVPIEFKDKAPAIKDNGWAKITGTINYYEQDGEIIPLITVKSMEEAPEPKQDLLY